MSLDPLNLGGKEQTVLNIFGTNDLQMKSIGGVSFVEKSQFPNKLIHQKTKKRELEAMSTVKWERKELPASFIPHSECNR